MSKRKFTPFEKSFIQERAKYCCEYCKFPMAFSHDSFHIEHITPLRLSGSNELENIAHACDGCNSNKWGYIKWLDSLTGNLVTLFHPRQDIWTEHFQWTDNFTTILGKTPTGRATIDLLKMNRLGLINIRKALLAYGILPIE